MNTEYTHTTDEMFEAALYTWLDWRRLFPNEKAAVAGLRRWLPPRNAEVLDVAGVMTQPEPEYEYRFHPTGVERTLERRTKGTDHGEWEKVPDLDPLYNEPLLARVRDLVKSADYYEAKPNKAVDDMIALARMLETVTQP